MHVRALEHPRQVGEVAALGHRVRSARRRAARRRAARRARGTCRRRRPRCWPRPREYPSNARASPSMTTSQCAGRHVAQRPQRAVGVDEAAERQARGRRDLVHVGVQARAGDARGSSCRRPRATSTVALVAGRDARRRRRPGRRRCRACGRSRCRARRAAPRACLAPPRSSPATAPTSPSPPNAATTSPASRAVAARARAHARSSACAPRGTRPCARRAASTPGSSSPRGRRRRAGSRSGSTGRCVTWRAPSSRSQAATPAGSEVTT